MRNETTRGEDIDRRARLPRALKRVSVAGLVMIAALAALVAASCSGEGNQAPPDTGPQLIDGKLVFSPQNPQLQAFGTAPVVAATPPIVRIPGRLVWDEERTVRLYPAFAGRVVKILVRPGDVVKAGQPLALLASPDFGQVQADARKATADFVLAEKNLARVRDLVTHGVAPQKDLYAAEADYARAQSELARASGRARLYGGASETVDQSFALRTPIAGTVVERNINPGQELRPDLMAANAPAMFVVTDPSRLWLQLETTERELPLLKTGTAVRFFSAAYPDETFTAKVEALANFIDPQTRTIRVRGSLTNPQQKLRGEMFVTAQIEGAPPAGVSVPAKAVFLSGNRYYVFVEEAPGTFVRTEVKTAGEQDDKVIVTAGVGEGQRVVVDGTLSLQQLHQSKRGT